VLRARGALALMAPRYDTHCNNTHCTSVGRASKAFALGITLDRVLALRSRRRRARFPPLLFELRRTSRFVRPMRCLGKKPGA